MSNDSEPGAGLPKSKDFVGKVKFGDPLPSLLLVTVAVPIILVIIAVVVSME